MSIPDHQTAMVMDGPGTAPVAAARPVAEPGPGQVLVKVNASSLNYHDNVNLMGLLPGPWPRVPMSDGAGEVVAIGPGVDDLAVGQRVMGGSVRAYGELCRLISKAGIKPHISHVIDWGNLDEALRLMRAGEHVGKIALTIT